MVPLLSVHTHMYVYTHIHTHTQTCAFTYKDTRALGVPRRNFVVVPNDGISEIHLVRVQQTNKYVYFWYGLSDGRAAGGRSLIFPNCVSESKLVLGCSWQVRNGRLGGFYSLHYKCYILEIHQITKLGFLGILRYKLKLTICFNLNLY